MPYSFTQIEKDKSTTISFVLVFLILFYFLVFWVLYLLLKNFFFVESLFRDYETRYPFSALNILDTLSVLCLAVFVGLMHWMWSSSSLIPRTFQVLDAQPLDPKDSYHQMFQNILDEVSVATGGTKMEGTVLPTAAMNAFSLVDFNGRAVIGVTEGLLARLTRAQLEAVIGHEAAHIVSGDCLTTSVTTSLFAVYSGMLNGMTKVFDNRSFRGGNRLGGFILLVYLLLLISRWVSLLLRMFISREREFRADAIAVRLTRDPLSLAEALYIIDHRWRGAGLGGEDMEAIFIANPQFSSLDESEGLKADLFSTHPPVKKRLDILMGMAHSDVQSLEKSLQQSYNHTRQLMPDSIPQNVSSSQDPKPAAWLVYKDGQWSGPFSISELQNFTWLKPETWVKKSEGDITPAYEDLKLNQIFRQKTGSSDDKNCPRCHVPLNEIFYEGVPILKCFYCSGVLVNQHSVQRILVREEMGFSSRIERIARCIQGAQEKWNFKQGNTSLDYTNEDEDTPQAARRRKALELRLQNQLPCPICPDHPPMNRMFYTMAYQVEVDKCFLCGMIWFDRDELEVLQCLVETNVKDD